jgi:hypothetical protein
MRAEIIRPQKSKHPISTFFAPFASFAAKKIPRQKLPTKKPKSRFPAAGSMPAPQTPL